MFSKQKEMNYSVNELQELHSLVNEQLLRQAKSDGFKHIQVSLNNILEGSKMNKSVSHLQAVNRRKVSNFSDVVDRRLLSSNSVPLSPRSLLHDLKEKRKNSRITRSVELHRQNSDHDIFGEINHRNKIGKIEDTGKNLVLSIPESLMWHSTSTELNPAKKLDNLEAPSLRKEHSKIILNQFYKEREQLVAITRKSSIPLTVSMEERTHSNNKQLIRTNTGKDGSQQSLSPRGSASTPTRGGTVRRVKLDKDVVFTSRVRTPDAIDSDSVGGGGAKQMIEDTLAQLDVMSQSIGKQSLTTLSASTYLDDLQSNYDDEIRSFESVALFAEVRLNEVYEKEAASGSGPTALKAVVCSDLIRKVTRILGRYSHVLEPLIDELMNSIFVNFIKLKQTTKSELELKMFNEGSSMKEVLQKFQTVRAAFDGRAKLIRDACFNVWRRYAEMMTERKRVRRIKKLRGLWVRWRQYIMIETRRIPDDAESIGVNSQLLQDMLTIKEEERLKRAEAQEDLKVSSKHQDDLEDTEMSILSFE
eukprot:gene12080-25324_t